ncbi:hypothetical protein GCM10023238_39430 [Streptomyces heliomycini]
MLATVDRPNTSSPADRAPPTGSPSWWTDNDRVPDRPLPAAHPAAPSRPRTPADTTRTDVLRIISDPRTPTYVTEYANGRRRYSYWRPLDTRPPARGAVTPPCPPPSATRCTRRAITLGEPVVDPNRTTYRVRPASASAPPPAPVRRTPRAGRPRPAGAGTPGTGARPRGLTGRRRRGSAVPPGCRP